MEEVRKTLFPDADRFVDLSRDLDKSQVVALAKASGTRGFASRVVAFDALSGDARVGMVFIDRVYGKHEFITYAVALDVAGAVRGIEIMDYRESYGDQVRDARWRAQFRGRKAGEQLQIDQQIRNISGATLSCVHLTEGTRRVLATRALFYS